ncbi:MAG TPA: hypothetical protein VMF89_32375 [Polyangiales bacterium]|nr:hypothetical protein [Polyangiales bacterium]
MTEAERALIDAAWDKLQADWQSDEAHRRFIALCALHGALGEAGSRYRAAREADPARSADVERRLAAVMAAALEQLSNARTKPREPTKRAMWLMVGICGFIVIQAVLALLRVRSQ